MEFLRVETQQRGAPFICSCGSQDTPMVVGNVNRETDKREAHCPRCVAKIVEQWDVVSKDVHEKVETGRGHAVSALAAANAQLDDASARLAKLEPLLEQQKGTIDELRQTVVAANVATVELTEKNRQLEAGVDVARARERRAEIAESIRQAAEPARKPKAAAA